MNKWFLLIGLGIVAMFVTGRGGEDTEGRYLYTLSDGYYQEEYFISSGVARARANDVAISRHTTVASIKFYGRGY